MTNRLLAVEPLSIWAQSILGVRASSGIMPTEVRDAYPAHRLSFEFVPWLVDPGPRLILAVPEFAERVAAAVARLDGPPGETIAVRYRHFVATRWVDRDGSRMIVYVEESRDGAIVLPSGHRAAYHDGRLFFTNAQDPPQGWRVRGVERAEVGLPASDRGVDGAVPLPPPDPEAMKLLASGAPEALTDADWSTQNRRIAEVLKRPR